MKRRSFVGQAATGLSSLAALAALPAASRDLGATSGPAAPLPGRDYWLNTLLRVASPRKDEILLFACFTGNGQDGLHLATSPDGLQWTPLNQGKSLLAPTVSADKLMRAPCIIRGKDGQFSAPTALTPGSSSTKRTLTARSAAAWAAG